MSAVIREWTAERQTLTELFSASGELSGIAENALADPKTVILVAVADETLAGVLLSRPTVAADRKVRGGIEELLVHRDHRGKGIGRQLMEAAEAYWRSRDGIDGMQLTVVAANEPARHLYESMGYHTVQERLRMHKDWGDSEVAGKRT